MVVEVFGDAFDDIAVELVDEPGLLQHGDEDGGREQAVVGRLPARQCLEPADLAAECVDDGLVVHLDVTVRERTVEILAHVVLEVMQAAHLIRVDGVVARRVFLDRFAGKRRFVVERQVQRRIGRRLAQVADARLEVDVRVGYERLNLMAGRFDAIRDICCIGEHGEVIGAEMRQAPAREILLEDFSDAVQAVVALLNAVGRIVEMKIRDIEEDRTGAQCMQMLPFLLELLLGSRKEDLHGRQVCEHWMFA